MPASSNRKKIDLYPLNSDMRPTLTKTLLIFFCVLTSGCNQISEGDTYEDCILKNMRGVQGDVGARLIWDSCRKKFPEVGQSRTNARELKPGEISAITGRAALSYGKSFSGNLYNGNKDLTVTQIELQINTKEGGKDVTRLYTSDLKIPAQSAKDFSFQIVVGDQGSEHSWRIMNAKGY